MLWPVLCTGSKSAGPGKAGRTSPGKKTGQSPQKGKDENPDPTRGGAGGGGAGGGYVSRPVSNRELAPAFYIGGGNGVSL